MRPGVRTFVSLVPLLATALVLAGVPTATAADGHGVNDSFDRPDSLDLGTADTGQAWVSHAGRAALVGGASAHGPGYDLAAVESGLSDGTVSATVTAPGPEFWLALRLSSGADYWRFGRWENGPYELQLIAGNSLRTAPLEIERPDLQPQPGDRLSCRMASSVISCWVGDLLVVRTSDATGSTASRHGLAGYGEPASRFDDFSVAPAVKAPDLRVSVSLPSVLPAGGEGTATASVVNDGTDTAVGAAVAVGLPVGAVALSSTPAGCTTTADAGSGEVVTCPLGDLAAGQSGTATVTMQLPSVAGPATVTAQASSTGTDADPSNDTAQASTVLQEDSGAAMLVQDTFSRADASTPGSTETGQPWRVHNGSLQIRSSTAAPGDGYLLASVDAGTAQGTVSTRLVQPGSEFWQVVRLQDQANYWRFGRSADGPYQLQLVRDNGLANPLVESLATPTAAAGDLIECRTGSPLTCSVNGIAVSRTTDPTFTDATASGLAAWNSSSARLDDFTVQPPPPRPDLVAALTGTRSVLVSGSLSITASVTNVGTAAADDTVMLGTLPTSAVGMTVESPHMECSTTDSTFTCSFGLLAPGEHRDVHLRGSAPASAGQLATGLQVQTATVDAVLSNNAAQLLTAVRALAPPGPAAFDDFARGDATQLGTATTGETWTTHSGSFSVVGAEAAPSGTGDNLTSIDPGFAFGTYEVTVTAGAADPWWLALRVQDAGNHYRIAPEAGTGYYRLTKVIDGVVLPLFASVVRQDVRARDGDVVRAVVRPDDSIYVYVNGQQVIDSGDVELMYVSGFGFGTAGGASTQFDDVSVSSVLDAFPITDSFSRADAVGLGTPETGTHYAWRTWEGDAWAVDAGRAGPVTSARGLVAIDASMEAGGISARFTDIGDEQWLVFRFAEDGSHYRFGAVSGGQYELQYVRYRTPQPLPVPVEMLSPPTATAGQSVAVRQTLDGGIELSVDGVVTHRLDDPTTNSRATIYGLASFGSSPRFDDVSITPAPRP